MSAPTKTVFVVEGRSGRVHDIEVNPGTTVSDVLRQLGPEDWQLGKGLEGPVFAPDELLYDQVHNWEKLVACMVVRCC